MGKKWCVLLGLLLIFSFPLAAQKPTVLLIAATADEALAFQAVSNELTKRSVPHSLVGIGVANPLLAQNPRSFSLRGGCHVRVPIHKNAWPTTQRLPEGDLMRVSTCLAPRLVLVGTHSRVQAQLAALFRKKNARVIAFYDDFEPPSAQSVAGAIIPYAHTILLSQETHTKAFQELLPKTPLVVTGNPKHEAWEGQDPGDLMIVKRQIIPCTHLNKKVILYIKGSNTRSNDTFEEFLAYIKSRQDVVALFAPPPGDQGAKEEAFARMYGATNFIVVPSGYALKTIARAADIVLCHRTHLGIEAALAGLPVAYFDTQQGVFKNPLTAAGLIPILHDAPALHKFIEGHTPVPNKQAALSRKALGTSVGATARMADCLMEALHKSAPVSGFEKLPWQSPGELRIPF